MAMLAGPATIWEAFDSAADVTTLAVGVFALGWGLLRWLNRPRFSCGIPPLQPERTALGLEPRDLGRPSVTRAFRHRKRWFAPRLLHDRRGLSTRLRARLRAHRSLRVLAPGPDGAVEVPLLLENRGSRTASGLTASVVFLPNCPGEVALVDATTESLTSHLYAGQRKLLAPDALERAAAAETVSAYRRHLPHLSLGDGIWLSGDLSAHTFELIVAQLRLEPGCSGFHVVYTVNSTDGFVRASSFVQACRVAPA